MKYQRPALFPMDKLSLVAGACVSGENATKTSGCLTGVSVTGSACTEGVHPEHGCRSGTLPANECASGYGDSEQEVSRGT
jgi:hypothetical protein